MLQNVYITGICPWVFNCEKTRVFRSIDQTENNQGNQHKRQEHNNKILGMVQNITKKMSGITTIQY